MALNEKVLPGTVFSTSSFYPYSIQNAVRIDTSASLSRTPSGGPTDDNVFTLSVWTKRSRMGGNNIMSSGLNGNDLSNIEFTSSDQLAVSQYAGAFQFRYITNAVFRDSSSWYHIVVSVNTDNATASERVRIYVNGVRITSFSTGQDPTLSRQGDHWGTDPMYIGTRPGLPERLDGYVADAIYVDGQAKEVTDFGEFKNGIWSPKNYVGTYGAQGFRLEFGTAASLGNDTSGNGRNFTPSGLDTNDQVTDTPTNNWCTLNSRSEADGGGVTYKDGNLKFHGPSTTVYDTAIGTFAITHKAYWEFYFTSSNDEWYGVLCDTFRIVRGSSEAIGNTTTYSNNVASIRPWSGDVYKNGVVVFDGANWTAGTWGCIAFDPDTGKFWVGKISGTTITWENSGNPAAGTGQVTTVALDRGVYTPAGSTTGPGRDLTFNFGQQGFLATNIPTDFTALNSTNEPKPTIGPEAATVANAHADINLFSGTGSDVVVSTLAFKPDFVVNKWRNDVSKYWTVDAVRGVTKYVTVEGPDAEITDANSIKAFSSNGYTSGTTISVSGKTVWGLALKGDGTAGATNNAGSIASTVNANPTAGFSIVTYTGNGVSGATVGHGLGAAPAMILTKGRSSPDAWFVFHQHLDLTPQNWYLRTDSSAARVSSSAVWNNTAPGTSVFTIGNSTDINRNTSTYVAYCFLEIPGFSSVGHYHGNAAADGPMITCGFRPRFVLIKNVTGNTNWIAHDTARDPFNPSGLTLIPDITNAEQDASNNVSIDFYANGFKIITTSVAHNGASARHIYWAFAENPFKYANAR